MDRMQIFRPWGASIALSVAAVSAAQALAHHNAVQAMGVICGQGPSPHCAWCAVGVVAATTGLMLFWRSPGARAQS